MYVIPISTREVFRDMPGIEHVTLAGGADGLRALSFWRQSMAPGSATPPHMHPCEEVILVTAGTGELHIEGGIYKFDADAVLVLPAGKPHQIINTGRIPLESLAVFDATPVEAALPSGEPISLPWSS